MKMNSQIKSLGKQAGYTLIELSIAIAIISVLIMSALVGVQKILENNNVDTTSQQVTLATANVNKFTTMLSESSFLETAGTAATLGIWPESIVSKAGTPLVTTIKNPFGGTYLLGKTSAAATTYNMGITNLSTNACVSLAAALSNAALTVGTDEVATYAADTLKPTAAVTNIKAAGAKATGANLATACASATNAKKNLWLTYTL